MSRPHSKTLRPLYDRRVGMKSRIQRITQYLLVHGQINHEEKMLIDLCVINQDETELVESTQPTWVNLVMEDQS